LTTTRPIEPATWNWRISTATIHEIGDLLTAITQGQEVHPDFHDGWRCRQVLDAASPSAAEQRWVHLK